MPTSAPGTSSRRGFTLIELLVVMLIMGLIAGTIGVLARPDDRAVLRVEAERLSELLDLAATEARLTGKRVAWTAEAHAYRFWQLRADTGWTEIRDDALRARRLPPGMTLSGLQIEALQPADGMRLEFSPHGALAYDFQISLGAERYTVTASPLGEVRIDASR